MVEIHGERWDFIASHYSDRADVQCQHRWSKVVNPELVKGRTLVLVSLDVHSKQEFRYCYLHILGIKVSCTDKCTHSPDEIRTADYLFGRHQKLEVFFSAASCKKDYYF